MHVTPSTPPIQFLIRSEFMFARRYWLKNPKAGIHPLSFELSPVIYPPSTNTLKVTNRCHISGKCPKALSLSILLASTYFFTGCGHISIAQQGLVSKQNVALSEEPAFVEDSALLGQTEPGTGIVGSAAGGCVSCK